MTASKPVILGSRGSTLALTQSRWVLAQLQAAHPSVEFQLEVIKTSGDADQTTRLDSFPVLGAFVKELQVALRDGRIDFAVHSLKDVPEDQPDDLILTAFPPREDARDVLVSGGLTFRQLPPGAKVGTGSPRRVMQLRAMRPDLEYLAIRGNVETRVNKVRSGELAATLLAAAGLRRLGRTADITHTFAFHELVPAIGQAALALECRTDDSETRKLLAVVNDDVTADMVHLERRFMLAVGGGCKVPMAAHAYPYGDDARFMAVMGDAQTGRMVTVTRNIDLDIAEEEIDAIAEEIQEECKAQGLPTPRDK